MKKTRQADNNMAVQPEALGIEQQELILKRERRANSAFIKLRRNKTAMLGFSIVCLMVLLALFAPLLATSDPNAIAPLYAYKKPFTAGHLFGTDEFGRDLFSRILYGARVSMLVAVCGTAFAGALGILLGLIAGYFAGLIDSIIMRIMDGLLAFPFVLLALILMTILGAGIGNVIIAIGIGNVPHFARVVRGEVLIVKNKEYISAGKVIGVSNVRLLFCHILPNAISPIIVYATLNVAGAIITEASLSFLGMGIATPMSSWGSILKQGKEVLTTAPHIATISGLFILITVLGFNLLGDGIRDVFDPKMKR